MIPRRLFVMPFFKRLCASFLILAHVLGTVPMAEAAVTQSNQLGQNLFTYSQMIDTGFSKFGLSVSDNTRDTLAPDGTYTASAIIEDGSSGNHYFFQNPTSYKLGRQYTVSGYFKAGTRSWVLFEPDGGTSARTIWFNVSTGVLGTVTGATATITPAGNGWYRCTATYMAVLGGSTGKYFFPVPNNGTQLYAGVNGDRAIYAWGLQVTIGSRPGVYNKTVASTINPNYVPAGASQSNQLGQNLLLWSEEMGDPTKWTHSNITATQNTGETRDPWGTNKAAKIVENGATALHYVLSSLSAITTDRYTFSVFLKNGNRRYASVYLNDLTNSHQATFDLQGGTVTNVGSTVSAYMIPMGNGWYRCVVVANTPPGAAAAAYVLMNNASGAYGGYAGDGVSYLYMVGAQAAKGPLPGSYNRTTASTINASYVPTGAAQSAVVGLSNIQLWLRADQGVTVTGGAVSSWTDVFSGRRRSITQATAINRPTLVTASNGRAAVRFDGSDDYLQTTFTLNQPNSVFIVYKHIALGAANVNDFVFSSGIPGGGSLISDSSPKSFLFAGVSAASTGAAANGQYDYVLAVFNGASSNLRIHGVNFSCNPSTGNAGGFTLGAAFNGTRPTNIEVTEVIVTSSVPTATEINTIETYFKARYGL